MRLGFIALAALLIGCAGTNFQWEDVAKVHDGMTEAEVTAVLGKPYSRTQSGSMTILTWSYAQAYGGAKAVSYRLVDGKVVGSTTFNR